MSIPASIGQGSYAVTPSDTADLPYKTVAFKVTTAGTIRFMCANGHINTMTLAAGEREPQAVTRIYATTDGTTAITATGIHGYML